MSNEEGPWAIALQPPTNTKHDGRFCSHMGRIRVLYDSQPIITASIAFIPYADGNGIKFEPNPERYAYYGTMVREFNRRQWTPSYKPWILAAARILQDSLEGVNGRRISHVRELADGSFSIACHPGALFWFSPELRLQSFQLEDSVRHTAADSTVEAIHRLIDNEALLRAVAARKHAKDKDSSRKDKATRRERELAELENRLAQWHNKYGSKPS